MSNILDFLEDPADHQRILFLADDHLVLRFAYDSQEVQRVKEVPGAKWDKLAKVWRVPLTSLEQARSFAQQHNLALDPQVALFDLPKSKNCTFGVEQRQEWIYLSFTYDPVKVRAVKTIPAVTWDAATKAWRAPLSSASDVIAWAEQFNEPVSAELQDLAETLATTQTNALQASRHVDSDLEVPGIPLLPYQRAGVAYAAQHRRCFIADDMGLGKTITSIASLEHLANAGEQVYPALIVCPPTLVLNWQKEWAKWCPHRSIAVVAGRKELPSVADYDVVVIGYSNIFFWQKALSGYRSMILDESHYIKTPTAQRTKAAIKVARSIPNDGPILCLTGTPITNRPAEYASQLDALGKLNDFGGRWGFYRRYCAAFRDRWGQWHIDGHSHLDELNERLRGGGLYIRRTKAQVLHDLPPVLHDPLLVEGDARVLREYRKAETDIVRYLVERAKEIAAEMGLSPAAAAVRAKMAAQASEHLVRLSVLRKLAALAKMAVTTEWVEAHLEVGNKVVLAAHHRDVVDALAVKFGDCRIQGGMSVAEVEEAKRRFQELSVEEAPVMVLSVQAARVGHTLTASQNVAFVELPFTPTDVDQTYSRCHRLGQLGSVTATYILCAGTIDENIYRLIESKRAVVNAATEGTVDAELGSGAKELVNTYLSQGLAIMLDDTSGGV